MRGLRRWNQLYELWTGLYMLDPWEKALFNTLAVLSISICLFYGSRLFGPVFIALFDTAREWYNDRLIR